MALLLRVELGNPASPVDLVEKPEKNNAVRNRKELLPSCPKATDQHVHTIAVAK
jgi:hypothetical protein